MRKFILFVLSLALLAGCTPPAQPGVYENALFTFKSPDGWTVVEGGRGSGKNASNYFALNLTIQLQLVRGPQTVPVITVARRQIPSGSSLQQEFNATYQPILTQIRNLSTITASMDGMAAFQRSYQRPWGEPWYNFIDLWIAKNGWIYVVSLQDALTMEADNPKALDAVRTSFHIK